MAQPEFKYCPGLHATGILAIPFSHHVNKKSSTDRVIKKSMELFGYTPEEKSDENIEWMLRNGYLKERKNKRGTRGRR